MKFPTSPQGMIPEVNPMVAQMAQRGRSLISSAWAGVEQDQQMRQAQEAVAAQPQNTQGVTSKDIDFQRATPGQPNANFKDAASIIRGFEGYESGTYWDVNAHRLGFGSDTVTDANGNYRKVVQGDTVDKAGAERDLTRRVSTEFMPRVKQALGDDAFNNNLTAGQREVLGSTTYNYGSLPQRLVGPIRSGDQQAVYQAIVALGADNNGINRKRRQAEADMFLQYGRK